MQNNFFAEVADFLGQNGRCIFVQYWAKPYKPIYLAHYLSIFVARKTS